MAKYQVTFIFDMPKHGFTESWFVNSSDTNLDVIKDQAVLVANKRMLLAGDGCTMQGIRISNADDPGRVGKTYGVSKPGSAEHGCAASNVALNCVFGTEDNRYQKPVQVRGFWDDWEANGGVLINIDSLNTAFNAWKSMLIQQQYGFRSINSRTPFRVTGYETTPAGGVTVAVAYAGETPGTTLLSVGPVGTIKTVRFSKVNGKSVLNGPQQVVITGANEVQLVKPLALTQFATPGRMEVPTFTVRQIANGSIQRIGNRQAGAPLLASVGRRSARTRT